MAIIQTAMQARQQFSYFSVLYPPFPSPWHFTIYLLSEGNQKYSNYGINSLMLSVYVIFRILKIMIYKWNLR